MKRSKLITAALITTAAFAISACSTTRTSRADTSVRPYTAEQIENLANFDDLDFRVYSGQKWEDFPKSHAEDIIVHYPDGSTTVGLPDHLDRLKPQFTFAPDTSIKEHPIKLADGDYTAVQGIMTGTFTQPMDLGNGKTLQPTGKKFVLPMATIGRWENGVMKEEWLYWDNAVFMQQITGAGN